MLGVPGQEAIGRPAISPPSSDFGYKNREGTAKIKKKKKKRRKEKQKNEPGNPTPDAVACKYVHST